VIKLFGLQEKMIGCIILIGTFAESLIEKYGPKTVDIARRISYKLGANIKNLYRDIKGENFEWAA
jgi:hypothetical protein